MRFRLIPVFVLIATVTLTVKVGGLWLDLGSVFEAGSTAAYAREDEPREMVETGEALEMSPAAGAETPEGAKDETEAESETPNFAAWNIENIETPEPEPEPELATLRDPYAFTDEEIELLQQLSERREEIDRRRDEMGQREALLTAAEERVEQKIVELEALRAQIEELIVQHDEQAETQINSLVKIYENMKPKDAAKIFEQLDMVVLLEVVDRMKERKAAPVLARLSPERAQEITQELAQRRNMPIAQP